MKPVRLSVRRVVEFVLRCGDVDSRYVDSGTMQDGARAHRRIQAEMGENYRREVSLRMETEMDGIPVVLQGRADGIIDEPDGIVIDEIKSTTLPLERVYEQRELHLGQAKCYAVMLLHGMEEPPDSVTLQLTYCQLDSGEIRRHRWTYTRAELEAFLEDLLGRYAVWVRFERDWRARRDESVRAAGFPFAVYRKGQRELAVAVYRAIERRQRLYVQAPTGIGKTISALFPSVKALAEGKADKLFYLTAKTVTRAVAEDAMRRLAGNGMRLKLVTLRAKEKICFCREPVCNPDACAYARGHYDRINGALLDLLEQCDLITPADVECYAKKHSVCPFEMALDAALWADVVVCDYNHVFAPVVYLRRFFAETGGEYVFLIDEAHNLADRVRDMHTAALRKSVFVKLKRALKDKNAAASALRGAMSGMNKYLLDAGRACGTQRSRVTPEPDAELSTLVLRFNAAAEQWLAQEQHSAHPLHRDLLALYFETLFFSRIAGLYDKRFTTITEALSGSEVVVTLFCLDPSRIIAEALGRAGSAVLFSATLSPLPYYRDILGGGEADRMLSLPSPFDSGRLLLLAHRGISTRYADRPGSLAPIAEVIRETAAGRRGNYIAYFPSYEYMRQVYDVFTARNPSVRTVLQQSGMDEEARAQFLAGFDAGNAETLVGFCVLGGMFSEGVDLAGDRLIGAVIVGVGLPKITLRHNLIRDYYDAEHGGGFDYAYVFPGMNKVLQAAGRVIRSETDSGVVVLIDDRFATRRYQSLYPPHWAHMRLLGDTARLGSLIAGFDPEDGAR